MRHEVAVSIRNVSKTFGRRAPALNDVTFDVPRGSSFALIGPNGAGKTTLFSIAAGVVRPDRGTIEVLGVNTRDDVGALQGRFALLPQDAAFQSSIPIVEQIELFCRLNGLDRASARQAAREALELVGLGEVAQKRARQLSHGMMKRLAIAQAFLGKPEVVFLDEPTSGLDPENAAKIRELVRSFLGDRTVVISSHNLKELEGLCSDLAILDAGKLVQVGAMRDFLGGMHTVRITFNRAVDAALVRALTAVAGVVQVNPGASGNVVIQLDVSSDQAKDEAVTALLQVAGAAGFVPRTIEEGERLESRFLEVTGGKSDGLGST